MRPNELIDALVARAGGTYKVAAAMRRPTFQGTLHKICKGQVAQPSRDSAERIARFFNIPIEALYDELVASKVAAEQLGAPIASELPVKYESPAKVLTVAEAMNAMRPSIEKLDPAERAPLAALIERWILSNGDTAFVDAVDAITQRKRQDAPGS